MRLGTEGGGGRESTQQGGDRISSPGMAENWFLFESGGERETERKV